MRYVVNITYDVNWNISGVGGDATRCKIGGGLSSPLFFHRGSSSSWALAFGFHLLKAEWVSWYIWALPGASLVCSCQAGQLCNVRMYVCLRLPHSQLWQGARGLCNWDVKEGMGGCCTMSSVSIFGCGCWEDLLRQQGREDVQWDIWGTSAGNSPGRLNGKEIAGSDFVYGSCVNVQHVSVSPWMLLDHRFTFLQQW